MDYSKRPSYPRTNRYRKKQSNEWITILLFYVLPFLVVNSILFFCVTTRPKVAIEIADTHDYLSTDVTVTIQSWFPTKDIQFSMAGEELQAEKGKKRTYTMNVIKNGTIEVSVTNINGMNTTEFEHVNVLDEAKPNVENTTIVDGVVTFTITDSQSGVNFDTIYAKNSKGEQLAPLTVDRSTSTLSFEMDPAGLHVYAQDKAGNEVLANFTSHKEGDVERLEGGVEEDPEEGAAEPLPSESEEPQDSQGSQDSREAQGTQGSQNGSTAASDIVLE